MNPTSFYSNKKNRVSARPVLNPKLSEDSDLSLESDESIYISGSESDYEDNSESTESHSPSDFSESNNELLVKPNHFLNPKWGHRKKRSSKHCDGKQQSLVMLFWNTFLLLVIHSLNLYHWESQSTSSGIL